MPLEQNAPSTSGEETIIPTEVNIELETLMRDMFQERGRTPGEAEEFIAEWRKAGYVQGAYGSTGHIVLYRDGQIGLMRH